jgi:hypothetical protein
VGVNALRPGPDLAQAGSGLKGRIAGASPEVLDVLDIAEHPKGVGIGARLLRTAMAEIIPAGSRAPEYSRFVPPDWRDRITSRRAVQEWTSAIGALWPVPVVAAGLMLPAGSGLPHSVSP